MSNELRLPRGRPVKLDFYPCEMKQWPGVTLLIVVATYADGSKVLFWPIRTICKVLGVSPNGQVTRLQRDHEFAVILENFAVPTAQGVRPVAYIAHDGLGGWLVGISSNRVRPEFQENVREFRRAVMREANRILLGGVAPTPAGQLTRQPRLTLEEVHQHALLLEERLGRYEQSQPLPLLTDADDTGDDDTDEPGTVRVQFTCEHGVTYTLRLQLNAQIAPHIVDAERLDDDGGEQ